MAIQYDILQRGFRNIRQNDQVVGFQLLVKSAYYRGVALSLIDSIDVAVNHESFCGDASSLGIGGHIYSFTQMATLSDVQCHGSSLRRSSCPSPADSGRRYSTST